MSAAAAVPQLAHTLVPKVEEDVDESSKEEAKEESPEVDIVINNVVCSFSVRCHLNLKEIALNGSNVEYRRENGMVTMKLRWKFMLIDSIFQITYRKLINFLPSVQAPLHNSLNMELGENHVHGGQQRRPGKSLRQKVLQNPSKAGRQVQGHPDQELENRQRAGHLHAALRHQNHTFLSGIQRGFL